MRATHPDTIDALTLTGETFYWGNTGGGSHPDSGQPRTPRGCRGRGLSSDRFYVFVVRVRGVASRAAVRAFLTVFRSAARHVPSPRPLRARKKGPENFLWRVSGPEVDAPSEYPPSVKNPRWER
jgi:hypothetical protein